MKKTFIIGAFVTIFGALLLGLGYMHNGNQSAVWQDGGFKIVSRKMTSKTFDDVKSIKLDTLGLTRIQSYNGSKIKVSHPSTDKIKYDSINQQLSVTGGSIGDNSFGIVLQQFTSITTIYVPNDLTLDQVEGNAEKGVIISNLNFNQLNVASNYNVELHNVEVKNRLDLSGYADLTLKQVTASSLTADVNDGDISIIDSKFNDDTSNISANDGDVDLKGANFSKLSISAMDGNVSLTDLDISDKLTVDASDGDIDAFLRDRHDVSIIADTDDGDAKIFGRHTTYYKDDGKHNVEYLFTAQDGNITVN